VQVLFDHGRPALFVTGHVGNWEIVTSYIAGRVNGLIVVYSRDENPFIETALQNRRNFPGTTFVDKEDALRQMLAAAQDGVSIGLLPDLRVDSGTMLPLFNVEAPTTISPARIAQRINYPMVPLHVERLPGGRFRVEFHAPLKPAPGLRGKDAAIDLTRQFYRLLEEWISQRPGQWLCTKRRWPKQAVPYTER
jgi:KDO2-lipid IV(A) lauroyltransferase